MDEVMCEYKWYTLPLDAKLGLEVAQDVAEVYVEELMGQEGEPVRTVENWKKNKWTLDHLNRQDTLSNLSSAADHDVVTVSVSNAQDVCGYTVACT